MINLERLFKDNINGFSFTEYLTVFVGLIFALAVAEFFISTANIVKNRDRLRHYWEFYVWIFVLLDLFTLTWYISWVRLPYISQGLGYFFLFTLPNLVIFITVAIYFPDTSKEGIIDLKKTFYKNRRLFFILFFIYMFLNLIATGLLFDSELQKKAWIPQILYFILGVINIIWDKIWMRVLFCGLFLIQVIIMFFIL